MNFERQTQMYRHEPHNDIPGDCYRTAIACMFGMPAHTVPHFVLQAWTGNKTTEEYTLEYLRRLGWTLSSIYFTDDPRPFMASANPTAVYLLSGKSPRGNWSHVVIAKGGEIIWDPYFKDTPGWGELDGPCPEIGMYQMEFLIPLIKV